MAAAQRGKDPVSAESAEEDSDYSMSEPDNDGPSSGAADGTTAKGNNDDESDGAAAEGEIGDAVARDAAKREYKAETVVLAAAEREDDASDSELSVSEGDKDGAHADEVDGTAVEGEIGAGVAEGGAEHADDAAVAGGDCH